MRLLPRTPYRQFILLHSINSSALSLSIYNFFIFVFIFFKILSNFLPYILKYYGVQDMVFDADSKSVLHTEMAKKNLFVKRGEIFYLFLI